MDSDELEQENGYGTGWFGTGIQMAGRRNNFKEMDLGRLEQEQRDKLRWMEQEQGDELNIDIEVDSDGVGQRDGVRWVGTGTGR